MNTLNISDKERLELIEESFNHDIKNHNAYSIADYDISWLIEQAKENQELKEMQTKHRKEISEMNGVIARQRKEIKDMRFKGQKQQRNFHRLKGVKHREWKC